VPHMDIIRPLLLAASALQIFGAYQWLKNPQEQVHSKLSLWLCVSCLSPPRSTNQCPRSDPEAGSSSERLTTRFTAPSASAGGQSQWHIRPKRLRRSDTPVALAPHVQLTGGVWPLVYWPSPWYGSTCHVPHLFPDLCSLLAVCFCGRAHLEPLLTTHSLTNSFAPLPPFSPSCTSSAQVRLFSVTSEAGRCGCFVYWSRL
jgi:hypothetical protein